MFEIKFEVVYGMNTDEKVMAEWRSLASNQIDVLVQDCSNSSALAMELLQFCTKPSIICHFPGKFTYTAEL